MTKAAKRPRRPRIRYQRHPVRLPTERMIEAFLDSINGGLTWRLLPEAQKSAMIERVTQPLRAAMYVYLENND